MSIDQFTMSRHALQRALDMQIDPKAIRRCLEHPDEVVPYSAEPEFDLYYGGDITCSVVRATGVVATILWRTQRGWAKDLKYRPVYQGREFRPTAGTNHN